MKEKYIEKFRLQKSLDDGTKSKRVRAEANSLIEKGIDCYDAIYKAVEKVCGWSESEFDEIYPEIDYGHVNPDGAYDKETTERLMNSATLF